MAIIKCKMCGGDMEISADKTFGTCEYCGSTMTLPKVSDEQRAAAFTIFAAQASLIRLSACMNAS